MVGCGRRGEGMLTAAIANIVIVVTRGDGGGRRHHGHWGCGCCHQWWAVDDLMGCLPVIALTVMLGVDRQR